MSLSLELLQAAENNATVRVNTEALSAALSKYLRELNIATDKDLEVLHEVERMLHKQYVTCLAERDRIWLSCPKA